jgi:nucleoside 2-deoxyribosyltransferase
MKNIKKECFVIMPFGEPFDEYYNEIFKPIAKKLNFNIVRADEIYGNKSIIEDIVKHIIKADIIIADVSLKNPNVNYELGLAHALNKEVVIISMDLKDVPFDYRHRRTIIYSTVKTKWSEKLENDIEKTIKNILHTNNNEPVISVLKEFYEDISNKKKQGIKKVFYTRQDMNYYINNNLQLNQYKQLDIIAFGLKSFRDAKTIEIENLVKQGLKIRILSIEPHSLFVSQKEKDENLVPNSIKKTILDLEEWCKKSNSICKGSVELKFYNSLPLDFFWRQDDNLFIGPYIYGIGSQQSITYELDINSKIGIFYTKYFENLWYKN